MKNTQLFTEGDVNSSDERKMWNQKISDPLTRQILKDDARYFLHQSMSRGIRLLLDVPAKCLPFAAMNARDGLNIAADVSLGHYTHEKSPVEKLSLTVFDPIENIEIELTQFINL